MFECNELLYIQMQKTGCTHIASLLSQLFDGRQEKKHDPATEEDLKSGRFVMSSIRNPWDWYLSLWTFGVQGKGGLMRRLTERNLGFAIVQAMKHPLRSSQMPLQEISKNVQAWREVYDSSDNVGSFRQWLRLIHRVENGYLVGDGYHWNAVDGLCGMMTSRYLHLCCRNVVQLKNGSKKLDFLELIEFESDNCYVDFFVRQERLEDDFCQAVEKVRPLSVDEKEKIYSAKKTNTSTRKLSLADYYDQESIDLVLQRDKLIIEKFNYSPPQPVDRQLDVAPAE